MICAPFFQTAFVFVCQVQCSQKEREAKFHIIKHENMISLVEIGLPYHAYANDVMDGFFFVIIIVTGISACLARSEINVF